MTPAIGATSASDLAGCGRTATPSCRIDFEGGRGMPESRYEGEKADEIVAQHLGLFRISLLGSSCPLKETIRRTARIGYDAIETGAAAPHAYPASMTPGRRRDITTCLSGNGIKLSSMLPAPGGGPASMLLQPIRWSGRPPSTSTSLWQTFVQNGAAKSSCTLRVGRPSGQAVDRRGIGAVGAG